jgi:hypothetical protein
VQPTAGVRPRHQLVAHPTGERLRREELARQFDPLQQALAVGRDAEVVS